MSLSRNGQSGSRPYRPSLGSAAAAAIPISRASIMRNNMMAVGAKNNERNLSWPNSRPPRRSTAQSLRQEIVDETLEPRRSNLPRARGFLLHGENFSSNAGCAYNPRAPRIIGYQEEETARSNGSAIPLGAPKTISRPLSGKFRGFRRPTELSQTAEDCEGCTCVNGECWEEPEPLECYDHTRQKHVRSRGTGERLSVLRNVSVQDVTHRLSHTVSVQVAAQSIDHGVQTDEEDDDWDQLVSRRSTSGQFGPKKKRSQSYPDRNVDGLSMKKYGSSDSDMERDNVAPGKRRKRSHTNPGTDRHNEVRLSDLSVDNAKDHSLAKRQYPTDDRDTLQRSREYVRQLMREVEQQLEEEMDPNMHDSLEDNIDKRKPLNRNSSPNRTLHYRKKFSEQSGKSRIEHDPVDGRQIKRTRGTRPGQPDRIDRIDKTNISHRDSLKRIDREKASELLDQMSRTSEESLKDISNRNRAKMQGNRHSLPPNKRRGRRDRDEELSEVRVAADSVQEAERYVKQIEKRADGTSRRKHNVEDVWSSEESIEEPERRHDDRPNNDTRGRINQRKADRSVASIISQRSSASVKKDSTRKRLNSGSQKEGQFRRSRDERDRRLSYTSDAAKQGRFRSTPSDKPRLRKLSVESNIHNSADRVDLKSKNNSVDRPRTAKLRSVLNGYQQGTMKGRSIDQEYAEKTKREIDGRRADASYGSWDRSKRPRQTKSTDRDVNNHQLDLLDEEADEAHRKTTGREYQRQSKRTSSDQDDGNRGRRAESNDSIYSVDSLDKVDGRSASRSRKTRSRSTRDTERRNRLRSPANQSLDQDYTEDIVKNIRSRPERELTADSPQARPTEPGSRDRDRQIDVIDRVHAEKVNEDFGQRKIDTLRDGQLPKKATYRRKGSLDRESTEERMNDRKSRRKTNGMTFDGQRDDSLASDREKQRSSMELGRQKPRYTNKSLTNARRDEEGLKLEDGPNKSNGKPMADDLKRDDVGSEKRMAYKKWNSEQRPKNSSEPLLDEEAALLKIYEFKEENQQNSLSNSQRNASEDYLEEQVALEEELTGRQTQRKSIVTKGKGQTNQNRLGDDQNDDTSNARKTVRGRQKVERREELSQTSLSKKKFEINERQSRDPGSKNHRPEDERNETTKMTVDSRSEKIAEKERKSAERKRNSLSSDRSSSEDEISVQAGRTVRSSRRPKNGSEKDDNELAFRSKVDRSEEENLERSNGQEQQRRDNLKKREKRRSKDRDRGSEYDETPSDVVDNELDKKRDRSLSSTKNDKVQQKLRNDRQVVKDSDTNKNRPRKEETNQSRPPPQEKGREGKQRAKALSHQTEEADSIREDSLDRADESVTSFSRSPSTTSVTSRNDSNIQTAVEDRKFGPVTSASSSRLSDQPSPSLSRSPSGTRKQQSSRGQKGKLKMQAPTSGRSVDSRASDESDITIEGVRSDSRKVKQRARQLKESRQHNKEGLRSKTVAGKGGQQYLSAESLASRSSSQSSKSERSTTSVQGERKPKRKKDLKAKTVSDLKVHSSHSISHLHENDVQNGPVRKTTSRAKVGVKSAKSRERAMKSKENGKRPGRGPSRSKDGVEKSETLVVDETENKVSGRRKLHEGAKKKETARKKRANKEVSSTTVNSNLLHPNSSRSLNQVLSSQSNHSDSSRKSGREGEQATKERKKRKMTGKTGKKKVEESFLSPNDSRSLASVTSSKLSHKASSSPRRDRKGGRRKQRDAKVDNTYKRVVEADQPDLEPAAESGKRSSDIWDVDVDKMKNLSEIEVMLGSTGSSGLQHQQRTDEELVKEISKRMSSVQFKKEDGLMKKVSLGSFDDSQERRSNGPTRRTSSMGSEEQNQTISVVQRNSSDSQTRTSGFQNDSADVTGIPNQGEKRSGEREMDLSSDVNTSSNSLVIKSGMDREEPDSYKRTSAEVLEKRKDERSLSGPFDNNYFNRHVRQEAEGESEKLASDITQPKRSATAKPQDEQVSNTAHEKESVSSAPVFRGVERNLSALPLIDSCEDCEVMVFAHQGTSVGGLPLINEGDPLLIKEDLKEDKQVGKSGHKAEEAVKNMEIKKFPLADGKKFQEVVVVESSCGAVSETYSHESCECQESIEVLQDRTTVMGSLNRERQEFISKDGKRVIFIPASENREKGEEPIDGKGIAQSEKTPVINSEISLIMQRLDSLTTAKTTHDQNEQTADTNRSLRHQSEQTLYEPPARKLSRDMGEQTVKQATREESEQTIPPRKMSRDHAGQTMRPLTRVGSEQTSGRMSKDQGEQTTRRMSKDEAEQTMHIVNTVLQHSASPKKEELKEQSVAFETSEYELNGLYPQSASQMFQPVTNQAKQLFNTNDASRPLQSQDGRTPTAESQSQTDHRKVTSTKDGESDVDEDDRSSRSKNKKHQAHPSEKKRRRKKKLKQEEKLESNADSESSTSSSDTTLSDGEWVTNPRMTGILLSQLDLIKMKRKAHRRKDIKPVHQEAVNRIEYSEDKDESLEDEEGETSLHDEPPVRRRSAGQVVTLEYESFVEFVDPSAVPPSSRFHQPYLPAFDRNIAPSESQFSEFSHVDVHRAESDGLFEQQHENEEDDVDLDVSVSRGSEHGELPFSHVAREDIVKLPDVLNANKRKP